MIRKHEWNNFKFISINHSFNEIKSQMKGLEMNSGKNEICDDYLVVQMQDIPEESLIYWISITELLDSVRKKGGLPFSFMTYISSNLGRE